MGSLIDRLRDPLWVHSPQPFGSPQLAKDETLADLKDAADEIERLRTPPTGNAMREALTTAVRHIEHMAAWITKQNAGYSFESLGEDMPRIRATLLQTSLAVTDEMVSAAIEAAWPGPEIVYADGHDSPEAMMRAALEAALAQPQEQREDVQPVALAFTENAVHNAIASALTNGTTYSNVRQAAKDVIALAQPNVPHVHSIPAAPPPLPDSAGAGKTKGKGAAR